MALENLGGVYKDAGDLEKAKRYHLQAATILKNNKSTQVDYAASLMDLGDIYLLDKNYMLAENAYLEAERIVQEVAGKETLTYQVALTRLLHLYRQWDNSEKTALYTVLQIENWHQRWIRSFATFTESDKAKSLESETGYLDYAFSVLYDNNTASKSLIPVLFTVNNDIDGLLLQNNSRITQFVSAKKDTTLSTLYNSWINYKKQYANALQVSSGEKQNQVIKELETKISQNEKQLLRYDPALEKILRFNSFSYRDIVNRLKPGEALVKWVNFNYHNSQNFTDSIFYGAFIVLAGKAEPLFVKVCEQKQLKEILRLYYNSGDRGAGEDDAELLPVKRDSLHFDLYNVLWKPLLPLMGNTKTIYNIPSGQIHRISFAALQDEKGRPVFDIYQVHQLLSVRDMINSTAKNTNRSALLFGGVNFSIQEAVSTRSNNNPVQKIPGTYNPTRGGSFAALEGTLKEVNAIKNILGTRKWQVRLFTGEKASKLNFTQNVAGNYSILHLATHGFYFPAKQSKKQDETFNEKIKYTDKPLLRSGIVFSGVNKYWSTNTMTQTENNGIVTAQEISNLDLSKTSLVVLSACETALGDINSTEGVYGLQRGFKMAGINKMIMSLWPVPDKETAELMQLFYNGVAMGQTFYNAFHNARAKIKERYKDPYKWAGFVLIGE